jgi:hypothetical protein
MIQDLMARFETFVLADVGHFQAVVQSHIAVVLEYYVFYRFDHAGVPGGIGQLGVMVADLVPPMEPPIVLKFRFLDFLDPGLHRKVGLPLGYDFFFRVGVLYSQITGVARHENGLNLSLCAFADFDHIMRLHEMIFDFMPTVQAGQLGFLDDWFEVLITCVSQHLIKVAGRPEFAPGIWVGALDFLEG